MTRKGAGYSIELIVSIFVLLAFAATSFEVPEGHDWEEFQQEVASEDLTYSLYKTGDLDHFLQEAETGSLKTAATTISQQDMSVSGTITELPILETRVGYNVLPKNQYPNQDLGGITQCGGDLDELRSESENDELRQIDTTGTRYDEHGIALYVGDTDPTISDGFNGQTDFDTLWVDNGTQCQFSSAEGPYYIGDIFLWGDREDDNPENYYEIQNITDTNLNLHKADQPAAMKKMLSKEVNGINTRASVDTFIYSQSNLSQFDVLVFREEGALARIQNDRDKIEDFMQDGSVMLLLNMDQSTTTEPFIEDVGLEWIDMGPDNSESNCPDTGDAVISSDCTMGSGIYHLNSFTVEAGATVTVENNIEVCDQSAGGNGCDGVEYSDYAPKLVVDGEVDIRGTIDGSGAGFESPDSTSGGQGAGESGNSAGGAGYGGDGTTSDGGGADGGDDYGVDFQSNRPGSAGGYDTDDNQAGGAGGGSIWIQSEEIDIDGEINMDGETGGQDAGGGSGGSIRIETGDVSGSGTLSVRGESSDSNGGEGAGGRVHVRTASESHSFSVLNGGGNDGSNVADSGSEYTITGEVDFENLISGFTTDNADEVESYFVGLDGNQRDISLNPGGWVKTGGPGASTNDDNFVYAINTRYDRTSWNISEWNLNTLATSPPGAPDGEKYANGSIELPNGTIYDVLNTCLGECNDDIWGLSFDFDSDGDYGGENEGPYLQGETLTLSNRRYRMNFPNSTGCNDGRTCVELAYSGSDEIEVINHVTDFNGFEGRRLARAAYEQEYEEQDVKTLASTIYWLRGDQLVFDEGAEHQTSTTIVGSIDNDVYMPYKVNLRWSSE